VDITVSSLNASVAGIVWENASVMGIVPMEPIDSVWMF
jgi:hypothetical protein